MKILIKNRKYSNSQGIPFIIQQEELYEDSVDKVELIRSFEEEFRVLCNHWVPFQIQV